MITLDSIIVENVSKEFTNKQQTVQALDNINLSIHEREFVTILGASGCGKSTLLRIIGGLEQASKGQVKCHGKTVTGPGVDRGMVFQHYSLFPWLTVEENIEYGLKEKGLGKKAQIQIGRKYIEQVGLTGFKNTYPNNLSGGMQQRVALARGLANNPDVLLLDEPFGALDMQTREDMQELLLSIWQQAPKTIVMVTHDVEEAILLANRVVIMSPRPGKIKKILPIDLGETRTFESRLSAKFLEYKKQASHLIRTRDREQNVEMN